MPYADTGPPPELFPTTQDLRDEKCGRMAARHGRALGDIDAAMDRIGFGVGGLGKAEDAEWYDVDFAEALAADLKALVAKHFPWPVSL